LREHHIMRCTCMYAYILVNINKCLPNLKLEIKALNIVDNGHLYIADN